MNLAYCARMAIVYVLMFVIIIPSLALCEWLDGEERP